jgi:hypothetical protein
MLSILRKARLKDKEMRILMLHVRPIPQQMRKTNIGRRGLDNAGKTTIVKKVMNEDVNTVSPTLGFIIKTIDFQGYQLPSLPRTKILMDRATGTNSTFGMSGDRRQSGRTGETTSRRPMP